MELSDLRARTLFIGSRLPVEETIESLLRMQNAKNWRTPISLYLGVGNLNRQPMSGLDVLAISSVISVLRSPIHTFAIGGLLTGLEPLLLAAGQPGYRHLLPHSVVCLAPIESEPLPLPNGAVGIGNHQPSPRAQANNVIKSEIILLIAELGLSPELWKHSRILSASEAIKLGFADTIIPSLAPKRIRQHDLGKY